jgi:hypothetical protein
MGGKHAEIRTKEIQTEYMQKPEPRNNTDKIHAETQTKKIQTKYMPRPQHRKTHLPLTFVPAH